MWARNKFSFDLHSLPYFPCPVKPLVFFKAWHYYSLLHKSFPPTQLKKIARFSIFSKPFAPKYTNYHIVFNNYVCLSPFLIYKVLEDKHYFIDICTQYLIIWLKNNGCWSWSNWNWQSRGGTELGEGWESENCNGLAKYNHIVARTIFAGIWFSNIAFSSL